MAQSLPSGTVTFLFTDVEGSTKLLNAHPEAYKRAVSRHHDLLRGAVEGNGGVVFETVGDAVYGVFAEPQNAVGAALAGQLALHAEDWDETPIRVRVGVHTGSAELKEGHYFGAPLYRCARLMSTAHGGQTVLSAATVELVRDALPDGVSLRDLGDHRLKDLTRRERVYQLLHGGLPAEFPALRSLDAMPNNLPLQLTSFVGREKALAEVSRLLSGTRLLTLTGAGGSGKTRLALQAAANALEDFSDGVFLVELASVGDAALVPGVVAGALGVREEQGRPQLATLLDWLRERRLLLVLDNCEHLLGACAELVEPILRACAAVHVVATSREPLGIGGETTWRLPSLALPSLGEIPSTEALVEYEAVRLFVDRATAAKPDFRLNENNGPAVAAICHRLDGIPLAIELAAARVRALPPDQLLARLEDRFRLLTGGSRTALPRQQTLQALVDWSYSLLSEQEKGVFTRLAVCSGGFTLEAAEQIGAGETVKEWEVVDVVTRLVDKSLVLAEEQPDGTARYRLLETLRQYARQRLLDSGSEEVEETHTRHAEHYVKLVAQWDDELQAYGNTPGRRRQVDSEYGNLCAALEWLRPRDAAAALRLVTTGAQLLFGQGHGYEVREWLHTLLPLVPERSALRGRALGYAAMMMWLKKADPDREAIYREALEIAEETQDGMTAALALAGLGSVAMARGEREVARAHYEEGVTRARRAGNARRLRFSLIQMGGFHAGAGEFDRARIPLDEALELARRSPTEDGLSDALNMLGQVARGQGRFAEAIALLDESLALCRAADDQGGTVWALVNVAWLARRLGDVGRAALLLAELVKLGLAHSLPVATTNTLAAVGDAAIRTGLIDEGVRLTAAAFRGEKGAPMGYYKDERDEHEAVMYLARDAVGDEAFDRAWEEGRLMTEERAWAAASDVVEAMSEGLRAGRGEGQPAA